MTKVKIMLGAVAVVAIVGSALAFRAVKADRFCLYQKQTPTFCPLVETLSTFTTIIPEGIETITPTVNGVCATTTTNPLDCTWQVLGTGVN